MFLIKTVIILRLKTHLAPGKILIAGGLEKGKKHTDKPAVKVVEVIDIRTSSNCDNLADIPAGFKCKFYILNVISRLKLILKLI